MKMLPMFSITPKLLRDFSLTKKQKFLLASFFVTLLQSAAFFLDREYKLFPIFGACLLSFAAAKILFRLEIGFYWLTVSWFPAVLALSTGLVHFYFPNTVLWYKAASTVFFFFVFYLLLLALNIFKVSAGREEGIPLLSAARTVLFLIATIIAFFSFTVLLKGFKTFPLQLFFVVGFSFLLSFFLFTLSRGERKDRRVLLGALLVSFVCFQVFLAFAFVPVETFFRGLIIAASFYVGISLERDYFEHKINTRLVLEYLFLLFILGVAVFRFSME